MSLSGSSVSSQSSGYPAEAFPKPSHLDKYRVEKIVEPQEPEPEPEHISDPSLATEEVYKPIKNREIWGTWRRPMDFSLTVIAYTVGVHDFWRFPYLCYRFGISKKK